MPTPADQIPPDPTTLARRVAALEAQVRELRAARRLENATVGAGGLNVAHGGRFAMYTAAGARMLDIGAIADPAYNTPDGSTQQAHFMRRQDGTAGLSLFAAPGSGSRQFLSLWDAAGNIVMSDDAASGVGLGRPYLPVPMWPGTDGGWDYWPRTSGTSMVELWGGQIYRQQPRLVVIARASMDTSGATGQVQLTVNGIAQGSPQAVSFSVGFFTFGPIDLTSYAYMQQIGIAVTGRRATGTGAIRAAVYSAYTIQS